MDQGTKDHVGKAQRRTHVKQRALSINMQVSAGSDTEVELSIPDCGGFLAAYGREGYSKLNNLQRALARTVETWFNDNPIDFGIGSPQV